MNGRPSVYNLIQDKLSQCARKWFARLRDKQLTDAADTGAYVVVIDITEPTHPLLIGTVLIGFIDDPDKRADYLSFAQEKCVRLALHPEHVSSAQSADESAGQYAGAVRSDQAIAGRMIAIGTSGLLALADESLSAMILFECGLCSEDYLNTIEVASANQVLQQLY